MNRADAYLTIPPDYADRAGGWRWAWSDAVEARDGTTLALVEQVGVVLEGLFAAPPATPFAFVLHLLDLMRSGPSHAWESATLDRLREACARVKSPGRNTGLLIAELCRGLPAYADPPAWEQVDLALKRRVLFGERFRPELIQAPPLTPEEFARALAARLAKYPDAALAHWLTHGGAPGGDGKQLADALAAFPRRVGAFLDELRKRHRLVGAAALAPALDAALTLPPRRPRPDRLPQGGYADVTTHGEPERLLPSQFALEADDFVRRYAERELLYFRREEPHRPTAPERWLVLDQGVRTWGPVRLGLAAGVVALLGRHPARYGRVRLALTSGPDLFDPLDLEPAVLADRLEASDLTANPGEALLRALGEPADPPDAPRDVLLLTHPRNLGEGDVRGAVRLRRPNDRLFALALDDAGRAELSEWTAGGRVAVRTFRVDLAAGEAATVAGPAPTPAARPTGEWVGDVEPVPFPYRAGLVADVAGVLGFDADAERVVVIGRGGVVQVQHLSDPGAVEVLPRAYRNGELLTKVEAVLGVAGGVVVCGRMPARAFADTHGADLVASASMPPDSFVAAHYDFAARAVKLHPLYLVTASVQAGWYAFPDLHCVAARVVPVYVQGGPGCAVDLATGGRFPVPVGDAGSALTTRARLGWNRSEMGPPNPVSVALAPSGVLPWKPILGPAGETLVLHRSPRKWATLRPVVNGEPLALDAKVLAAELAGDVLVVLLQGGTKRPRLYALRGPDGAVLGEYAPANPAHAFALSRDGGRLARQTGGRAVEVRATAPGGDVSAVRSAAYHTRVHLNLSPTRLRVWVGRHEHTFTLDEVPFRHERGRPQSRPADGSAWGYGTSAVAYDRDRFTDLVRVGPWVAAFDKWGQVVLMTVAGHLVMTVLVRREWAAAWLPDGTRWGSAALLGCRPNPIAASRIGQALQLAAEGMT